MIGPQAGFPDARTVAEWFKHQRVKYALDPGRRVYSHALPAKVFEASTSDRTKTRNATPLRVGGGQCLSRFTFYRLP
jgi:hypothetical protein